MCAQRKYVQFHNIKFKMPNSQLLIRLETSFKNWQNAQHVNMYFLLKVYICCCSLPLSVWFVHLLLLPPPKCMVCTFVKILTIMDGCHTIIDDWNNWKCSNFKVLGGRPKMSTFSQVYKPYATGRGGKTRCTLLIYNKCWHSELSVCF